MQTHNKSIAYAVYRHNRKPNDRGERTTVETKDFESLRIDQSQIVAIVDKSDQQVTYDGETWCSYEKVYNT